MESVEYKVLVVDDVEKNLQIIGNLLKDRGISISFALNGKEALAATRKKKVDLILLDIAMPIMDGYEVCQELKNHEETKNIPVIFLTARNEVQDIVKGFAYGAVDYITKPFNKEELISRVYTHLELKKSQEIIKNQNKKLEALNMKLMEHTHIVEQLNSQLQQKNSELTEINVTKDKFFSIISHDLKSPLSSIISYTELLMSHMHKEHDDDTLNYSKVLHDSTNNALKLLENLLEWSQTQTGKINFEPRKVNIINLIEDNILILKDTAEQKSIKITFVSAENQFVFVDIDMINTVLRNIISNAIKYSRKESEIKIETRKIVEKGDEFIEVSIADSGIGMSETTFNSLFKIENNISHKGTEGELGTGLGLILSKDFVEQNGGRIWAESKKDIGSTFYFTISIYRN